MTKTKIEKTFTFNVDVQTALEIKELKKEISVLKREVINKDIELKEKRRKFIEVQIAYNKDFNQIKTTAANLVRLLEEANLTDEDDTEYTRYCY